MAMYYFKPRFNFVACDELRMPVEYKIFCDKHGIEYHEYTDFSQEVINETDLLPRQAVLGSEGGFMNLGRRRAGTYPTNATYCPVASRRPRFLALDGPPFST